MKAKRIIDRFRIKPGERVHLENLDPSFKSKDEKKEGASGANGENKEGSDKEKETKEKKK